MKIAACMMVHCPNKRHEVFFRQALASIEDMVDQVCVVNAKSTETDRTEEILREWGKHQPNTTVKFLAETWQKDFSLHRNQSIALADEDVDWVFILDSDDKVRWADGKGPKDLREYLEGQSLFQNNIAAHIVLLHQDRPAVHHNQPRLFRRKMVKYSRKVHNTPNMTGLAVELCTLFEIDHQGYAVSQDEMLARLHRSQELLEEENDGDNTDPSAYFFLANNYALQGDTQRARVLMEKYIDAEDSVSPDHFNVSAYPTLISYYLEAEDYEKAEALLMRGIHRHRFNLDINFYLCEYGTITGKSTPLILGGQQYVIVYNDLMAHPDKMGGYFCYTLSEDLYLKVRAKLACVYALETDAICKELDGKCTPEYAEMIKGNLAKVGLEQWAPKPKETIFNFGASL